MRIAQVAPLTEAVPPKTYGGTERVVSFLTEELVNLGHDVTLFASGDSVTSATLWPVWPQALRLSKNLCDTTAPHMLLLEIVAQKAKEFDIIHFHMDYWPFSCFSRQGTPFVTTLHGRLDIPELPAVFNTFPHIPVISISDNQRLALPQANFISTIYHGLPETLLQPQASSEYNYLAFLGRICPEKGIEAAIDIAEQTGMKLKIAAKVDKVDKEYFETKIKHRIKNNIEYIGEINEAEKQNFLSHAFALLLPIDWPEPFGLVMIEAMACGTPVMAFNRGSVPEIIENGRTGLIVNSIQEAIKKLPLLASLNRKTIRQHFEKRFTAKNMALNYVAQYKRLINPLTSPGNEIRSPIKPQPMVKGA